MLGMALGGALLGGLGGALNKQEGGVTNQTSVWGPQQQYLQDIYNQAQGAYGNIADQGFMSDMERQAMQQGQGFYNQMGRQGQQLSGGLDQAYQMAQNPFDFSINYGNVEQSMQQQQPYLQDIISQSTSDIYQQLEEGPLKQADVSAIGSGNIGSSRKAVTDAVIGARGADQASRISADIMSQGYQQALGQEQNRIAQEYQGQQNQIGQLSGFGQLGQQYGGQSIQGLMGLGSYGLNAQNRALQAYQQAIGSPVMESTGYQLEQGGGLAGGLGGALSGAGTGLSMYGMMGGFNQPTQTQPNYMTNYRQAMGRGI